MGYQEHKLLTDGQGALTGATLAVLLGWLGLLMGVFDGLSYDLPFRFGGTRPVDEVVIVYLDEASYTELGQNPNNPLDRAIHARLIRKLAEFGPKAIIFDMLFDRPSKPEADQQFAQAIRGVPGVLLTAKYEVHVPSASIRAEPAPPIELFGTNNWGVTSFPVEQDGSTRRDYSRAAPPGMTLKLCQALELPLPPVDRDRWLFFYGRGAIPAKSYYQALQAGPDAKNVFSGKVVVVGEGDVTTSTGSTDRKLTPLGPILGTEVVATACLNVLRRDWLARFPPITEVLVFGALGVLAGFGLARLHLVAAVAVGCALLVAAVLGEVLLRLELHIWSPWLVFCAVQLPVAVFWPAISQTRNLHREKLLLERALAFARAEAARVGASAPQVVSSPGRSASAAVVRVEPGVVSLEDGAGEECRPVAEARSIGPGAPPSIPDYTLIKLVGQGAYGQVWLAQNTLGGYCAMKIVYRKNFASDVPFAREFHGLQSYAPRSLSCPALVPVLHVGRREAEGYFFYVMVLADDASSGGTIDPSTYEPRNLARELKDKGPLPVSDCIELGLKLAGALKYLHEDCRLVHRDIKPANIIFVEGIPRLADIGLVTGIDSPRAGTSYVGTEGYIPPEGPGTVAADIFSLGKVIYEASMGLDRTLYPSLPHTLLQRPDYQALMWLNEITLKSCEMHPRRRYASAARMEADLLRLQKKLKALVR